jgi:hypothetical protein
MADKKIDNVFAVEKLIKTKQEKGKTFYLVKWKGWSARHNTWEPEENILDDALLAEYNERQAKIAQKKAEKSEKTANKKRGSAGSTGKKEKTTPEQPPSKRPRRLAGGDIREESSDSSEHVVTDEQEEAPSTSTAPPAAEEENGTEEPEAAPEALPEEPAEDEPQEQEVQDEQERVVELTDEETENDTENEMMRFVGSQPDYDDAYGDEAPEMVDYEHDEEGIELPEEGYIVGRTHQENGTGSDPDGLHSGLPECGELAEPDASCGESRADRVGGGRGEAENSGNQE